MKRPEVGGSGGVLGSPRADATSTTAANPGAGADGMVAPATALLSVCVWTRSHSRRSRARRFSTPLSRTLGVCRSSSGVYIGSERSIPTDPPPAPTHSSARKRVRARAARPLRPPAGADVHHTCACGREDRCKVWCIPGRAPPPPPPAPVPAPRTEAGGVRATGLGLPPVPPRP